MRTKNHTDIDRILLEKAVGGDHDAFGEIVRRYEQMVYSFAFKVCRDKMKAEETLQDTFINVYRKLKQYKGKSKFSTWIYSIVTRNCLMINRQRKVDAASISLDTIQESQKPFRTWRETPLEELLKKETQEILDKSILKLPLDYRVVFILRDVEGLSTEETAEVLGLSVPAIKSRLHRARVFLREHLNTYMTA